jgi:hypothetical protein
MVSIIEDLGVGAGAVEIVGFGADVVGFDDRGII